MARTTYKKKIKNGKEYYFYRLRHENLLQPKDFYGKTVKELGQKIKNEIKKLDNNIVNNNQIFSVFLENWLFDVHFPQLKPTSQEKYEGIYRKYIKNSSLAHIKIKDISINDIQKYYSTLLNNRTSVNCINNINKIIAPCIRYAYNNNFIIKDFTPAIKTPKETEEVKLNKNTIVNPFTKEEQIIFISTIKGHPLEMLFITALNTGMRQGELLALTWDDINFADKYISVNKTVRNTADVTRDGRSKLRMQVQTPKTKKSIRKVPISSYLVQLLENYKNTQVKYTFKIQPHIQYYNLVFCNSYGKYLDASNVRKNLNKIIDTINKDTLSQIKLKHHTFHDLRHTFATRLFELGENPKTVQELLGHSNVSITLDTYTHVLNNIKQNAISKLDTLYQIMDQN